MKDAAEYLAVPLLFTVEPIRGHDNIWRFRTAYPELTGCATDSERLTDAMDELEALRQRITLDLLAAGEVPPEPRPPLGYLVPVMRQALTRATDGNSSRQGVS